MNNLGLTIEDMKEDLIKLAGKDIKTFFNLINEVADEFNKFIPFILEKKPPKTEEQLESEREWIEEQKQIAVYEKQYEGETLAFTKRGDELILVAHALFQKDLYDGIDKAVQDGRFNRGTEYLFFR